MELSELEPLILVPNMEVVRQALTIVCQLFLSEEQSQKVIEHPTFLESLLSLLSKQAARPFTSILLTILINISCNFPMGSPMYQSFESKVLNSLDLFLPFLTSHSPFDPEGMTFMLFSNMSASPSFYTFLKQHPSNTFLTTLFDVITSYEVQIDEHDNELLHDNDNDNDNDNEETQKEPLVLTPPPLETKDPSKFAPSILCNLSAHAAVQQQMMNHPSLVSKLCLHVASIPPVFSLPSSSSSSSSTSHKQHEDTKEHEDTSILIHEENVIVNERFRGSLACLRNLCFSPNFSLALLHHQHLMTHLFSSLVYPSSMMVDKIPKESERLGLDPDLLMKPPSHSPTRHPQILRLILETCLLCCTGGREQRLVMRFEDGLVPLLSLLDDEIDDLGLESEDKGEGVVEIEVGEAPKEDEEDTLSQIIYNIISFLLREEKEENASNTIQNETTEEQQEEKEEQEK